MRHLLIIQIYFQQRDHKNVLHFVIVEAICIALSILLILVKSFCIACMLIQVFLIYLLFCTYSLYKKLEKESKYERTLTVRHVTTIGAMAPNQPMFQFVPQMFAANQQYQHYQSQPLYSQHNSKFVDDSGLPSYDCVVNCAPPK